MYPSCLRPSGIRGCEPVDNLGIGFATVERLISLRQKRKQREKTSISCGRERSAFYARRDICKVLFSSSSLGHLEMEARRGRKSACNQFKRVLRLNLFEKNTQRPWKRGGFWIPRPLGVVSIGDNRVYCEHLS